MRTCDLCGGDGLIGSGDNPRLKLGVLRVCTECSGTGMINDEHAEQVPETDESETNEIVDETPVDNAPEEKSFLGRIFGI